MATYVNNLRLKEIATGDESGTWGTSTNTNLELIADAFGYSTESLASDADATITMADGAADGIRALYVKITSGVSLTATRIVTIAPNTVSKVWIIENATSGSQSITISQGSGSTVTIANGTKAMVYSDGAGATAAVVLATPNVPVSLGGTGATTLTSNNVILGNGTSAVQFVAPGTTGNVLTSNGTTWTSAVLPAGGLTYVYKTSNYTTQDKEGVLADTSGGAFTVTLPASPSTGAQVVVADAGASWGTNNLTVGRNGSTIGGLAENLVCDITGASVQLVYDGSTWEVYAQIGGNGGNAATQPGNNAFTGANTFHNATGQTFGTATTTQDGIILAGRSGGSSSYRVTLQPTTLTASRTLTLPDATDTAAVLGTAQTFTALQTFSGSTSVAATKLTNAKEVVTVSATAATGTINYDVTTQSVLYYTSNASANWTVNFRGSSGTSLNTLMSTGESVTVAFLVTQGSTAYYNNTVQVDGSSVTPKYQGGTAWAAGNASSIDAYTYTIVKTGNAAFTVFAAQTKFA